MNSAGGYCLSDTIAAEATPRGRGGISVLRVSGTQARKVVSALFDRALPEPGQHRFGRLIRDGNGVDVLDEVVVTCFGAPHSYTGEEAVEISTHGSPVVVAEALDALYAAGTRPAGPGEFTLRAFLNERIDLTQAEAVADLVAAGSREAVGQALRQLRGGVGRAAERISNHIAGLLTQCELELDFVEDDVELASPVQKTAMLESALDGVEGMLNGYRLSRRLREGVKVAITGPPNVGKSSLFNALVGEERAIVHPVPGTTRDILRAPCVIGGITFELFDTAGLTVSGDDVESEGIRRAVEAARQAELSIFVTSVDTPPPEKWNGLKDNRNIRALNKIDLGSPAVTSDVIPISVRTGEGLDRLKSSVYDAAASSEIPGEATISRERHYLAVSRAREALLRAHEGVSNEFPAEMIAEELREALGAMDELTGKRRLEGLLDEIFADFCIGK